MHVTRDGGKTWTNVTPKDMPDFGRVSMIDASAFDAATAYISVKRPLLNDRAPYIFRTHDYGRTWTKIVNGIRADDYVHAVREDPTRKGLLYAGTQHGVYISYDDGANWESLSLNLPDVPVVDLIVEPNELAIATHGRGFWVLDNIAPLRQYAPAMAASSDPVLFAPPAAVRATGPVAIKYWLKQPAQRVTLEILDATGKVMRAFVPDTARAGAASAATAAPNMASDSMRAAMRGTAAARSRAGPTPRPRRAADRVAAAAESGAGAGGRAEHRHVGPAHGERDDVSRDDAVGRVDERPDGAAGHVHACGSRPTAGASRSRSSVKRNPRFTDVTDADLRAQFALATQHPRQGERGERGGHRHPRA